MMNFSKLQIQDSIEIKWEYVKNDPPIVNYFVNDFEIGANDQGFDEILALIKKNKKAQVILRVLKVNDLGGKSLRDSLPFSARYKELVEATPSKKLIIQFD